MTTRNPDNERLKLTYFDYLKHAEGQSEKTLRQVEKALLRFEEFTRYADLKTFDRRQAAAFKDHLANSGISASTILSTVNRLKRFLSWSATQPGYKSRIKVSDIAYLNLSEKEVRAASAPSDRKFPTLDMVERVVRHMPTATVVEKRDRALIAFTAISGIRDGTLITLKLKHIDLQRKLVLQNPSEVETKFSKRIDTFFLPLSEACEEIVFDWVATLRKDLLFSDGDPLFPKTLLGQDENSCFQVAGLARAHWANASPVRAIFKAAFEAAGLPPYTPHSFRHMIVSEMYRRELTVPEFKAWSQNLGHEGAMTTLTSYGKLSLEEQGRLIRTTEKPETEAPLTRSELERVLKAHGL